MKVYSLTPQAIENEKRKGLIRGIATAVIASALGAGIPIIGGKAPIWILIVTVPLFVIIFSISFRRALKILEENWSSYQLLIGSDTIVKKQRGMTDIELRQDQITNIEDRIGTGLIIRTQDKKIFIHAPSGLEDYAELKEHLLKLKPHDFVIARRNNILLLQILAVLTFGAGFAIMMLSNNPTLVIGAGIFVIVYMIWAFISLRQRKDIDARVRLSIWKMMFVILVFGLILYGRLDTLLSK